MHQAMYITTPRLRHKIILQAANITNDNSGNSTINWLNIATIWADVKTVRSHEYFMLEKRDNIIMHNVIVRFSSMIKIGQRIIFRQAILIIKSITCLESNFNFLSIIAEEILSNK